MNEHLPRTRADVVKLANGPGYFSSDNEARQGRNREGEERNERRKKLVAVPEPRKTHSGPGGRPSICCSCRFRRKYPPTMYWVLPVPVASSSFLFLLFILFRRTTHVTGRLLPLHVRSSRGEKVMRRRRTKKGGRVGTLHFPIFPRTTSKNLPPLHRGFLRIIGSFLYL